jgi:hypothetical protein
VVYQDPSPPDEPRVDEADPAHPLIMPRYQCGGERVLAAERNGLVVRKLRADRPAEFFRTMPMPPVSERKVTIRRLMNLTAELLPPACPSQLRQLPHCPSALPLAIILGSLRPANRIIPEVKRTAA